MAEKHHKSIRDAVAGSKQKTQIAVRKIAFELFSRIIMRSPVDTGRFRGNWMLGIGEINRNTVSIEDPGAVTPDGSGSSSTKTAVQVGLAEMPFTGQDIFLTNSLPYARRLEYDAWSKQAPSGMVRVSIEDIKAHYGL